MGFRSIFCTRNLGRYAPKFLAPAEGWWPSATNLGPFGPPFGSQRVPIRYPQNFVKTGLDLAEIYRILKKCLFVCFLFVFYLNHLRIPPGKFSENL